MIWWWKKIFGTTGCSQLSSRLGIARITKIEVLIIEVPCPVNISEKMANLFLCKKMIRPYGSERNPKKYIIFKWIIYIWYLPDFYSFWYFFYISGNIFVIAAIVLERNLQGVANYLILSLAVADLLVAVLVMPLAAVYEVSDMICSFW